MEFSTVKSLEARSESALPRWLTDPCPALVLGLVASEIGLSSFRLGHPVWQPTVIGVAAAGIGLAIRPNYWIGWLTAAVAGGLATLSLPASLDSIKLLFSVLTAVAAGGAILLLLPRVIRRIL